MKKVTIEKSTTINASKERVWDVILKDKYNIWFAEFGEGTHAETDWTIGSKAIFCDTKRDGLVCKIITNEPYRKLSLEYVGILIAGEEDYESEIAKQIKGGTENYFLTEYNGKTQLNIKADMGEDFFESMSEAWDKALRKINEISVEPKDH